MAIMKKVAAKKAPIKKAQNSAKLAKGSKPGEMSGVQISDKDVMTHPDDFQHLMKIPKYKAMLDRKTNKYYRTKPKAKSGKSFPDLNKDGKVTKADILKGRGVIAKKGAVVKKAQSGAAQKQINNNVAKIAMSDAAKSIQKSAAGAAKNGKSMKKCKYGCK